MDQYVSKSAVIAEIKSLNSYFVNERDDFERGYHYSLNLLLSSLDTLQQANVEHDIAEKFARIVRGHLYELTAGFNMEFERAYFEVTGEKMYKGYSD